MTVRTELRVFALVLALAAAPADAAPVLLISGEVRAVDAQPLLTPRSNVSPMVLRYYLPEGSRVEAGDVVLRIDPGDALTQVTNLQTQVEQARAQGERDLAELQVRAIDAERAVIDAKAAAAKAAIDAAIPKEHLSGLDYDRYQGERTRAEKEFAQKEAELATARAALVRRREDVRLQVAKLEEDLRFAEAQVGNAEVRADRAGVVVHGSEPQRGSRYDEGSSAQMGAQVGEVVGDGPLYVLAWALESERARLAEGQAVRLRFDALPGASVAGVVEDIGGVPESRNEWGSGRYFKVRVQLPPEAQALALLPGMSVRVEVDA